MKKMDDSVLFCRFSMDGRAYSGKIRANMVDIVEGDPFAGFTEMRISYPLSRVRLLAPFTPRKIWCVGRNYYGHVRELQNEVPEEPLIFSKPTSSLVGPGDAVRVPTWVGRVDYEGELAVVIKSACRNVEENDASKYILGYTCLNDVTARDLQKKDPQWTRAKGFDTFCPIGPALLLSSEIPPETQLTTRHNGKVVQQNTVSNMIFSIGRVISHISRFATLEPGDIIATGTPEGIGRIAPGDTVEVEIDGIGTLSNPFIADNPKSNEIVSLPKA